MLALKNSIASNIGYSSWQDMVNHAASSPRKTVIVGGYINTVLIDATAIVTNALAAGRITTGNLTVTDGAKIGAWDISGGSLVSANNSQSKILLNMSGNKFLRINEAGDASVSSKTSLMSIRNDSYSGLNIEIYGGSGYALRCLSNAGTANAIESYGNHIFAQRLNEKWNAPGVLCAVNIGALGGGGLFWGNGCSISSISRLSTGTYRVYHNLGHTQYSVAIQPLGGYGWVLAQLKTTQTSYFEFETMDANKGYRDAACHVFIIGRNKF